MTKPREIPFSRMQKISDAPVFVKHFSRHGSVAMRSEAHRDDYYILGLLTEGTASVEIDFDRIELQSGNMLIVSPWQVHGNPAADTWQVDGWILAFPPEMLSELETEVIERYSISPKPFSTDTDLFNDLCILCSMLERNIDNSLIASTLASAIKSIVISTLDTSDETTSDRYKTITLRLRKLLDIHLIAEKSPAAYASMLNISEVYLNEAVKGATGLSAGTYIRNRVIIRAKRLFAYTSLSAKEIAHTLGYDDYAYFSKLFKKNVGCNPSDFRKNLK